MSRKLYKLSAIEKFIEGHLHRGGDVVTIAEGSLGWGTVVLHMAKVIPEQAAKFAVIKEVPLNEWSSGHTVTFYKKLPKKYASV